VYLTPKRIAVAAALALSVLPVMAEVLILSEARAGSESSDTAEIWCYYSKDGTQSDTVFGTSSLYVVHHKSLAERILGQKLSALDMRDACPKTINNYLAPLTCPGFSDQS
jgi:hypothetical protein